MAGMGRERRFVLLFAVAASLFTAGTYLAPLAESAGRAWGSLLRLAYAPLCHQMPERSLWIAGHPQAVCARCAGLYLGGVVGLFAAVWTVVAPSRRLRPAWLLAAALPSLVDFALGRLGLAHLANAWRFLAAVPFGLVAGLFLANGLTDLVSPAAHAPLASSMITIHPREKIHG